jgi:tetratricopeptide (TPR) repeat protein
VVTNRLTDVPLQLDDGAKVAKKNGERTPLELAKLQRLTQKTLRFPSPSGFLRLAKSLFANGQTKAAAQVCVKSMHAFPRSPGAYLMLATIMQRQHLMPRAIETLITGHSRNPDNAEICIQLAQIYLSRDQDNLAARFLVRAEKLDADNTFIQEQLALLPADMVEGYRQQGSTSGSNDDVKVDKLIQQPGVHQIALINPEGRALRAQHAPSHAALDIDMIAFLSKEFITRAQSLAQQAPKRFVIQCGAPATGSVHGFIHLGYCLTVVVTGDERPALIEMLARPVLEKLVGDLQGAR